MITRIFLTIVLFVGAGVGAGCGDSDKRSRTSAVPNFDSADFRLSEKPLLSIGDSGQPGTHELAGVVSAHLSPSGRLALLPWNEQHVRIYDRSGKHVRTFGRAGDGPGEFRVPASVFVLPNESVVVYDEGARRISHFDSAGAHLRTIEDVSKVICCFADGSFLFEPNDSGMISLVDPDPRDTVSTPVPFAIGSLSDSIASRKTAITLDRPMQWIPVVQPGFHGVNHHFRPFYRHTTVAIAGDAILHGTGSSFSYSLFARDSTLLRTVSLDIVSEPVSAAEIAHERELFIAEADAELKSKHQSIFDATPHYQTKPAYREIMTEEDGTVWIRRYEGENRGSRWWICFSAQGELRGTLFVPRGLAVERFTRGNIIVSKTDTISDLVTLMLHKISRN